MKVSSGDRGERVQPNFDIFKHCEQSQKLSGSGIGRFSEKSTSVKDRRLCGLTVSGELCGLPLQHTSSHRFVSVKGKAMFNKTAFKEDSEKCISYRFHMSGDISLMFIFSTI